MRRIVLLGLVAGLVGCGYVSTEFVDVDGTMYKSSVIAPPFGKIGESASTMAYDWDGGGIKIGTDAQGLDNTGQALAMRAIAEGVARGMAAYGTGGLSEAPGLVSGMAGHSVTMPRASVQPAASSIPVEDVIRALESRGYQVKAPTSTTTTGE